MLSGVSATLNKVMKSLSGSQDDVAHKRWWEIAEIVFGLPLLISIGLQFVFPLSITLDAFRLSFILLGTAFVVGGVAIVILARQELARRAQPTDPGLPTTALVTTGVFSVSRNPMYLGATCCLLGVALATSLPWELILLLPSIAACDLVLIRPEERYLDAKFAEHYRRYCDSVHRWFGRR